MRANLIALVACLLVAEVIDSYHEHMEGSLGRHMRLLTGTLESGFGRFSKSYPPGEH